MVNKSHSENLISNKISNKTSHESLSHHYSQNTNLSIISISSLNQISVIITAHLNNNAHLSIHVYYYNDNSIYRNI